MPPFGIEWLDEAQADVRGLDRPSAMRVFEGILHYAESGAGDVEPLHGEMPERSGCGWVTTGSCSRW